MDLHAELSGLGDAAGTDQVARRALQALLGLPDVRRVGLALTEGGGRRLRFTSSDRDHDSSVDWCHIDAYDDVPLTSVVRTGRPVVGALDDLDPRYAGVVEHQRGQSVTGLAALPLIGSGPVVGGMVLFYDRPQTFDPQQVARLSDYAGELADRLRRAQSGAPRQQPGLADLAVEPGAQVTHLEVAGDPRAVASARDHLREGLTEWGVAAEVVDVAVLCLSELVTNAVIHTSAPSEVRASLERGVLTVAVRDRGNAGSLPGPTPERVDPLRVHGRGLQMVASLSARWGSELDTVGTTVWFVLEIDAQEQEVEQAHP